MSNRMDAVLLQTHHDNSARVGVAQKAHAQQELTRFAPSTPQGCSGSLCMPNGYCGTETFDGGQNPNLREMDWAVCLT
jgi:hypothetical protein